MQDHVHDGDDVGEALLLLAVEGLLLKCLDILGRGRFLAQIVEGLAQKAGRTAGPVIDALADLRLDHLDHGADERARRVIFAAVPTGIAHVLELGFVDVRQFVLMVLRAEVQAVHQFERVAQRIAALEAVFDLAENLADLVFDRVRAFGAGAKTLQIGKQVAVDVVDQVGTGLRLVVVEAAVFLFRRGPDRPAMLLVDNDGVFFALKLGLLLIGALQIIEVFEKQNPGGLLGIVELGGATGLFAQYVVDIFECLFKHLSTLPPNLEMIFSSRGASAKALVCRRHASAPIGHGECSPAAEPPPFPRNSRSPRKPLTGERR